MTDASGASKQVQPGSIGITITVIEYNGTTGAYRTVKTLTYRRPDKSAAATQGESKGPAA